MIALSIAQMSLWASEQVNPDPASNRPFRVHGLVLPPRLQNHLVLQGDDKTRLFYLSEKSVHPHVGDIIEAKGLPNPERTDENGYGLFACKTVGKGNIPPYSPASIRDIKRGLFDNRLISVRGRVLDAMKDDIAPNYTYLILADDEETIPVTCVNADPADLSGRFLQSEVEVCGFCSPTTGHRRKFHPHGIWSEPALIRVLKQGYGTPFEAPELDIRNHTEPNDIRSLGQRRVDGFVLAKWNDNQFLLRSDDGQVIRVTPQFHVTLPDVFRHIRVVGLPETDMFNVNLSSACWKVQDTKAPAPDEPQVVTIRQISPDRSSKQYDTSFHGRLLRVRGRISHLPAAGSGTRMQLESDGVIAPIDVSAVSHVMKDVSRDCEVEVTGVCVMEMENWRPTNPFPRIRDFFLVTRSDADLRVLSRPLWWTTTRLMTVCCILLGILAVFAIWNRALQHLVARRSRQLFRSQIEKVSATLRIEERTRLAVELHDSLSQNLTAVSFQISAAASLRSSDPETSAIHLANANRMLKSCRTELKNCLFDLRGNTLEEPDFTEAIRRTLSAFEEHANIAIRFNVPRARCNDTTVHAILRIIRELVANAVRHGNATAIRIAGDWQDNVVSFSVKDNGCGFIVDAQPGIRDGCFGLQGIRERVRQLGGTFTITSAQGQGAYAVIRLNAPFPTDDIQSNRPSK